MLVVVLGGRKERRRDRQRIGAVKGTVLASEVVEHRERRSERVGAGIEVGNGERGSARAKGGIVVVGGMKVRRSSWVELGSRTAVGAGSSSWVGRGMESVVDAVGRREMIHTVVARGIVGCSLAGCGLHCSSRCLTC